MKEPILSRTLLFDLLKDKKTMIRLDWNLVDTVLGGMLEPRSMSGINAAESIQNFDVFDAGFTSFRSQNEDTMQSIFSTGGILFPRDYNPY